MNKRRDFSRFWTVFGLVVMLALTATTVMAREATAEQARTEAEARLEEAQARLEAAAREIAELTAQLVGDAGITALSGLEELARRPRAVMLGITIGPVGDPAAREDGVLVLGVTPGSAAEEAGIRSGDVLASIGSVALDWSGDSSPLGKLREALRELEPGTQVELGYRRHGRPATATVEARPWSWAQAFGMNGDGRRMVLPPGGPPAAAFMRHFIADRWGDMELVALSPGLGEYFGADEGVLVVRAPSDTTLGLEDGDVIVAIAGRVPQSPGHVARILRSYAPGERLVMTVLRKGERRTLEADVPG